MKNTIFTGSGVAIVTPMHSDGTVNYHKLGELLDWHVEQGTDAIIICGTTGESSTLTDAEHKECIRYTVERINHRIPVVAGTGSNDTAYAIHLSQEAESLGVDGLLLVTPYYNKTSQSGLVAHFTQIADSVSIPCILYTVPGRTGMNMLPATLAELSHHKNICGVKEASGNIVQTAEILSLCGDRLDVYTGEDAMTVPTMSLGGKGVITVMANILPKETHDMTKACLDGDFKSAAAMQLKYIELIGSLFADVNPVPIKEAMNLLGYEAGPVRLPLYTIEPAAAKRLEKALKNLGMIK